MYIRKIPIPQLSLKGLHKYSLQICELFLDVKMDICIFVKTQRHSCKMIFYLKLLIQYPILKQSSDDTISGVNCVMGHLNVKNTKNG